MDAIYRTHLSHVALLLRMMEHQRERQDAYGAAGTPPEMFLVRDEGATFWELVCFRARGHGAVLLGALRFKRQQSRLGRFARQPLSFYLSSPPKELGITRSARPAGLLEFMLPDAEEDAAGFMRRMRAGGTAQTLFIDAELIDFAFDFRLENPSVERETVQYSGPTELHLLRTVRGHVLSGHSHGLYTRLHRDARFFAVRTPTQHTPGRTHPLPTLAVHRSFLAMDALVPDAQTLEAWLTRAAPFHPDSANRVSLLVPDPV